MTGALDARATERETLPEPRQTVLPRRLSYATLGQLPAAVRRPAFDVAQLRPGILHLGCGAFHRAHQAVLTQRAIEAEMRTRPTGAAPPAWGIVGTSLCNPTTPAALRRQDGLYAVLERGPAARVGVEVVGTVRKQVFAPESPTGLGAQFMDPAIRLVTLTITAAGYCTDPATGRMDVGHPEVVADLGADPPRTAIGHLVDGLAKRRELGLAPPVVLSCDNIPRNGRVLRQACVDFAALTDDRLSDWIARNVQFPCSMVDRIVPVTTDVDRADAARLLGVDDAMPVCAEPFLQWVLESFDGPRPRWEAAGAEFVSDVGPWEASKLRLLNGGHLALAYLGLLAGHKTVAAVMTERDMERFILRFMLEEQMPTLPPSNHDIRAYAHQLVARWRNPGIVHRLDRVARDGASKVPGRLLESLYDNLAAGRPAPCTILAVAAWMRCATGQDFAGNAIQLQDGRLPETVRVGGACEGPCEELIDGFLGLSGVFDRGLRHHEGVCAALRDAMEALRLCGPRGAVKACLAGAFQ